MTTKIADRSPARILLIGASLVVLVAGLRAAAPVVLPLLLALFLTILSLPLLNWLERLGVRFGIAYLVTLLIALALLSGLGFLISGTATEFVAAAPDYLEQLVAKVRVWMTALEARNIPASDWLTLESIDPTSVVNVAGGILGGTVRGVASAVSFLTLVLLTMAFMLAEAPGFWNKLVAAFGVERGVLGYLSTIGTEIERYVAIKTLLSAATGTVLGLWVAILGVPFPLLWALAAFLLNYIPNIGSVLAAVPPVLVALVQFGVGRATLVAIGYLVVNFVLGNVVEPRVMGRRFGLSTLVVFVSLIFWGWLWGPLGMLLSVPLSVMVKIMLENSGELRWAAVLLGPSPTGSRQEVGRRSAGGRESEAPPS